ncbi:hypothetical protein [Desulfolucanica intricata]|uniref:hypothetical protein n=1 Tax=Desulfolucanica intricata TaxID=1285191 RepID=UPI0008301AC1|nr:hypothetical protein [Desulfolucanica intricata]
MKVNEVIEVISTVYELGEKAPTINLFGKPGIGKSAAVYKAARIIGHRLGIDRSVPVVDIRLIHVNPVDLRGLPYPDVERGLAVWLQSGLLPTVEQYGEHLILFWDELTSAPPTVQAAAFQVVWERRLGDWKMAPNWIQVVAGNRITDRGVTYQMPTPLANRMVHLPVEEDLESWKKWALESGIDSRIIAFLNFRPQLLSTFDPNRDTIAFASPRSWEILSNLLKCFPDPNSTKIATDVVRGTIGDGAASEFLAFCRAAEELPDPEEILRGKTIEVPEEPDILYALSGALVSRVANLAGHTDIKNILENFLSFTLKMPDEFSVLTVRDALKSASISQSLRLLPEWTQWAKKYRKYIL